MAYFELIAVILNCEVFQAMPESSRLSLTADLESLARAEAAAGSISNPKDNKIDERAVTYVQLNSKQLDKSLTVTADDSMYSILSELKSGYVSGNEDGEESDEEHTSNRDEDDSNDEHQDGEEDADDYKDDDFEDEDEDDSAEGSSQSRQDSNGVNTGPHFSAALMNLPVGSNLVTISAPHDIVVESPNKESAYIRPCNHESLAPPRMPNVNELKTNTPWPGQSKPSSPKSEPVSKYNNEQVYHQLESSIMPFDQELLPPSGLPLVKTLAQLAIKHPVIQT